ncbi:hypothetical protein [uncultured Thiodictyon sp.]|uniref:hypothetical protein n=1 Tax=uncultured Thiodictyon sp. TaxID=1846217 RepID=UPI0025FE25F6|nr:hypothetical protein [uncultured Thiodictyon sp.]
MNGKTYELFRFTHPDGSAKEWGYAEMGTGSGLFEVRWGKAGQLVQSQPGLTRAIIHQRRTEKMNKGYQPVGRRLINTEGEVRHLPRIQSASEHQPAPPPPPKKPQKSAIDIAALLGGDEDGFYF